MIGSYDRVPPISKLKNPILIEVYRVGCGELIQAPCDVIVSSVKLFPPSNYDHRIGESDGAMSRE